MATNPYDADNERIANLTKAGGGSYSDLGNELWESNDPGSIDSPPKYTDPYDADNERIAKLTKDGGGSYSDLGSDGLSKGGPYEPTPYLEGTHQASDYSGSGSGGGYETNISPKASATMNDSPSYDYEQSSRAKRSSASGDRGNEVSALARTGVGGDQVSTLASAGRKKVI